MKIKYLGKLSEVQIYDQVLQILNYSGNFMGTDKFNLAAFFSNFSNILNDYVDSEFEDSLKKSLNCIIDSSCYLDNLKVLKNNNKHSFIIAPLSANDHIFVSIIYKKDDNFECFVVNKGYRPYAYTHSYEHYIVPYNRFRHIVDNLGYNKSTQLSTDEIYKVFLANSIYHEPLYNITSNNQKEGNCFFKEVEAGFKFAYSNAYIKDFTIPKWPISTLAVHHKFLSNIKDECPNLSPLITEIENVYNKNKSFRIFCKILPDLSFEKKADMFRLTFSNGENSSLQEMLKNLDLQTITENTLFLANICNINNVSIFPITAAQLLNPPSLDLINSKTLFNSVKEFFPYAHQQLELKYSIYLDSLGVTFIENNDFYSALDIYNSSISFNPNYAHAYALRAFCFSNLNYTENALTDFSHAIKLDPNNVSTRFLYASFLYENNNLYAALSECNKIKEIEPNFKDNLELHKQVKNDINMLWQP